MSARNQGEAVFKALDSLQVEIPLRSALEARDRINLEAKAGIGAFGRDFESLLIDKEFLKSGPGYDIT